MTILSQGRKPDNFESHNSLKLSFTNTRHLRSNFVRCESFLESNSLDILALYETNLEDSVESRNFYVRSYLPLIWMDSVTDMHGYTHICYLYACSTSFCMGLISGKLVEFFFMFFKWLYSIQYLASFFCIDHLLCLYAWLLMLFHLT